LISGRSRTPTRAADDPGSIFSVNVPGLRRAHQTDAALEQSIRGDLMNVMRASFKPRIAAGTIQIKPKSGHDGIEKLSNSAQSVLFDCWLVSCAADRT